MAATDTKISELRRPGVETLTNDLLTTKWGHNQKHSIGGSSAGEPRGHTRPLPLRIRFPLFVLFHFLPSPSFTQYLFPSPSPSPPPFHRPLFSFSVLGPSLLIQLGGLGDRCNVPEIGPQRSDGHQGIFFNHFDF